MQDYKITVRAIVTGHVYIAATSKKEALDTMRNEPEKSVDEIVTVEKLKPLKIEEN